MSTIHWDLGHKPQQTPVETHKHENRSFLFMLSPSLKKIDSSIGIILHGHIYITSLYVYLALFLVGIRGLVIGVIDQLH